MRARYPSCVPNLFILAGPNGAGKSTSAPRILSGARRVDEFVNADVIAKEEGVSEIEAGRRTLAKLDVLLAAECGHGGLARGAEGGGWRAFNPRGGNTAPV